MNDVLIRSAAMRCLAEKHQGNGGDYYPYVLMLTDDSLQSMSFKVKNGLMRTRHTRGREVMYLVTNPQLYGRTDLFPEPSMKDYGFRTPEEAIDFALENIGLIAARVTL